MCQQPSQGKEKNVKKLIAKFTMTFGHYEGRTRDFGVII